MPLLILLSGSTTSQPDYSLPNLILMAFYVGLTLVLAIVAVVAIVISSRQSRNALVASDKQSKDAIGSVQKQIDASERQARETIEAVNRQIEASERQAQESLFNQHKPIVIPKNDLSSKDIMLKQQNNLKFTIGLQNKGAGVAMNTFAILAVEGLPEVFCSTSTWILSQDTVMPKGFDFNAGIKHIYPYNEFEEVFVFPKGAFGFARLMITYSDIFDNRYFGVFDYSEEFGWRMLNDVKRVTKRLDELILIKH